MMLNLDGIAFVQRPKMIGTDVVLAAGSGTARSSDGGRTWRVSAKGINTKGTNVTSIGEMMAIADGRTANSLTMMIRAGSKSGYLNHAVAQSEDGGDTWGDARLLPIVGTTCEGSIGRDASTRPASPVLDPAFGRASLPHWQPNYAHTLHTLANTKQT